MATQVLRSSKIEAGDTAMMPAFLVSSGVLPPVRRYLIATARKKRVDFDNNRLFAGDSQLIGYRNPFARQGNSSIASDFCFRQRRRNATGNGRKIAALVTTSHLFWPNHRRKPASSLPSWLRNFHFPPAERQQGGRGVPQPEPQHKASTEKRTRKFSA
jgi:hypothetical protein